MQFEFLDLWDIVRNIVLQCICKALRCCLYHCDRKVSGALSVWGAKKSNYTCSRAELDMEVQSYRMRKTTSTRVVHSHCRGASLGAPGVQIC